LDAELTTRLRAYNETYIYDQTGECGSDPVGKCQCDRGGLFDQSKSSSWSQLGYIDKLNSLDNMSANTGASGIAGQDYLTINGTFKTQSFPVAIPRISGGPIANNMLGLGRNSRLLNLALNSSYIASRSWSLFWGQTGLTSDTTNDGALVLGGLDQTQTTGANYTGRIQASSVCPSGMILPVTNMEVVMPNGSHGSIMGVQAVGQSNNYCLLPEFSTTTMFRTVFQAWIVLDPNAMWAYSGNSQDRALGSNMDSGWGMIYPNNRLPQADLKITIDNGLAVTIPNHQLVQAYYTTGSDGNIVVNDTYKELVINPLQGQDTYLMPRLASTFLQAAYLHVNYDENTFTVWQAANPAGKNSKYIAVGGSLTGPCKTDGNNTNTGNTTNTSNPNTNPPSKSTLSAGAIAGIIIGALALITAIALLTWCLKRRNRKQSALQQMQQQQDPHGQPTYYIGGKAELPSEAKRAELEARMRHTDRWTGSQGTTATPGSQPWEERVPLSPQEMPHERY